MNVAPKSGLPYFGWLVLAGGALSELLAQGATSYAAGLFVLPLQAEFGLSRANASSPVLIFFLGAVFVAPLAGRILDRYPIRLAMCAGILSFSGALALIALSPSLWIMVLALLIPAAMGFMMIGPLTTSTLASRWFYRRRGLALGIAAIATSGGGFVVVPLLSAAIGNYGWRHALLGEAAILLVIVTVVALIVVKDDPFRAGLAEHPENKGRNDGALLLDAQGRNKENGSRLPWPAILGNRGFWAPSLLIATISGISQAIVVSVPAYGHQLGFSAVAAAFMISAFSIAAALTKILAGVMADFWDSRFLLFVSALAMPLSLAILYGFSTYPALIVACCLAGIALGGVLPTSASLIAARFGAGQFGSVMGWSYALLGAAIIAAVRFTGSMFDNTGSYRPAFAGLLTVSLALLILALVIDSRVPGRGVARH
ncbi:MAG TPA: MFS transporter [Rhizomicrobium sp.]|jgi:MFS family permease|nr:MFS transporter [Rhizomicrobium sp.]